MFETGPEFPVFLSVYRQIMLFQIAVTVKLQFGMNHVVSNDMFLVRAETFKCNLQTGP